MPKRDRLTARPTLSCPTAFEDMITILMANVEDALEESGAEANVDYTFRDLLQAVMPIVTRMLIETPGALTFTTGWPAPEKK